VSRGRVVSPLGTWLSAAALARFRCRRLGRTPVVLRARDRAWRTLGPDLATAVGMAAAGAPFQIVVERRYDRSADARRLRRALGAGATIFLPQAHQVLPRLARLMVALRASLLGPGREECSFLFLVEGRGRPGMGPHHDGEVDAFWLQLEGQRRVTIGPPVRRGAPADLDPRRAGGPGWRTLTLDPGTLFYLPPRTPHDVVCHGRSLAVSLTWRRRAKRLAPEARAAALVAWDVVAGHVDAVPPRSRRRLWTQVPAVAGPVSRGRFTLTTPDGALVLPAAAWPLARHLASMPSFAPPPAAAGAALLEHGIVAPRDLPRRIIPADPGRLDGWRFA
jgi:hypothetical protein